MAISPRPDDDHIGARIRYHRNRRRKTQPVVAGLAGITTDYLSQIERGRKTPSAQVLRLLASALEVPAGTLLGDATPATVTTNSPATGGEGLAMALMSVGAAPVDLEDLGYRVRGAWATWNSSGHRFSRLLPELPDLIREVEATVRGLRRTPEHRRASAIASDLYGLLRTVTRRTGRSDLSFVVADRGLRAAEDADDPVRLATARWNLGHTLLIAQEYHAAVELANDAAECALAELDGSDTALALAGALHLIAAIGEARAGKVWAAWSRLNDSAVPLAKASTSAANIGHTMFSAINVSMHAMGIELEAGNSTEALRIAGRLDPAACPSVERRFTLTLDIARAHEMRRDDAATLLNLLEAERVAPEDLAGDSGARAMISRLLRNARPTHRRQAAALADRVGVHV